MKNIKLTTSVLILAFGIVVSGCSKGSDSAVIAKVNGANITVADFKKQMEELNPQLRQAVTTDPTARKEFLENQILTELLIQEAKKQGLDKAEAYKKNMEMHKQKAEEEKKKLDQGLETAARYELINSILKKEVGEKMNQTAAPTDKEVREYYNTNKEKIRTYFGKQVSLKEMEPQIKMILTQEKQSRLYLEYAKGLKAKASISTDDKTLDTAMADLNRPPAPVEPPKAPAAKEGTK